LEDCVIVKQSNCQNLRKYFYSAWVVDRWNRLEQKDIDSETANGFRSKLEKKLQHKDRLLYRPVAASFKAAIDPATPILVWPHQVNNQENAGEWMIRLVIDCRCVIAYCGPVD